MNCMVKISNAIENFFEFVFSKIGYLVFRYSWQTLLVAFIVDIALCCGWMKRDYVSDVKDTWIPSGSQSLVDYERYTSIFGQEIKMHSLYVTKPGEDLLTKANLLKIFNILEEIASHPSFASTCQRMMGQCFVNSPLFVWMNRKQLLQALHDDSAVKEALNKSIMVNISSFTGEFDPKTVSSSYVWMMFFQNLNNVTAIEDFESYFDKLKNMEGFRLYPNSAGAQGRELKKSITGDLKFLGISYALCFIFISLTLGKLRCGETRIFLALMGIAETGLAFAGAIGLGSFCGISYTPPVSVIPFIILGIATDNAFLLTRFLDSSMKPTTEERFIDAFGSSGATITISTLTNIVAFAVGAITPIPALATFGGFASLTFFVNYLLTYFFFGPFLAFDTKWKDQGRADPFFCNKIKKEVSKNEESSNPKNEYNKTKNDDQEEENNENEEEDSNNDKGETEEKDENNLNQDLHANTEAFEKYSIWFYRKVILSLPGKIILLILLLAMIGVSIYATLQFRITYTIRLMIPKNSFLDSYYKLQETVFSKINGQIYLVNTKPMDLATADGRAKFEKARDNFKTAKFFAPTQGITWYEAFLQKNSPSSSITSDNFMEKIISFHDNETNSRYLADIILSDDRKSLVAVKGSYSYVPLSDGLDIVDMMVDSRKKLEDDSLYPWSYEFITAGQYEDIGKQVLQNLLIAIAIVFAIILLTLADILASLLVTIIVAAIDVAVFGYFLTWWGVDVNTISAGNLVIVIGLSVDYSAHVMHAYLNPTGKYENAVLDAIAEVGLAVLLGALSTFLAVFPLAFCQSAMFVIFFKTFFGTIVAGILYSLILLPIILSLIGKILPPHTSQRSANKGSSSELEDDNECGNKRKVHAVKDKKKKNIDDDDSFESEYN